MMINKVQAAGINFGKIVACNNEENLKALKKTLSQQGKLDSFEKEYEQRDKSPEEYTLNVTRFACCSIIPSGGFDYRYSTKDNPGLSTFVSEQTQPLACACNS